MTVIDEYLASLHGPEKEIIEHMYDVVREMVPGANEELSYNMPTFKHKQRGVVAIMANKNYMSLYPFCNLERLGLDMQGFETTKGSIHFTVERPISDELLRRIMAKRLEQIG
jgi:uncharacterized protein YdhG (YjbR/CyaY superfamily)